MVVSLRLFDVISSMCRMRATLSGCPACASPPTAATPSSSPAAGTRWSRYDFTFQTSLYLVSLSSLTEFHPTFVCPMIWKNKHVLPDIQRWRHLMRALPPQRYVVGSVLPDCDVVSSVLFSKVWNLANCKLKTNHIGHTGYLNTVTVSPDGSLCASGGKVWSMHMLLLNSVRIFVFTLNPIELTQIQWAGFSSDENFKDASG